MAETENIIIRDTLDGLGTDAYSNYLAHALCLAGSCRLKYNGEERELQAGDLMIVRKGKLVERIRPADGFRVKVIYVTSEFIVLSTPLSNYGMKGQLALFLNPIMKLDAGQRELCRRDFEMVESRLAQSGHHFRRDLLIASVQMLIIDFFDFHSHLYGVDNIPLQSAAIMSRFLNMLENGTYREHREVNWYADKLCVTPKYLSEVSRKISGYAANYWINRYTVLDISRLLRDKSLTFVHISDMFGFSSPAYFSRYVQQHLGVSPTESRGSGASHACKPQKWGHSRQLVQQAVRGPCLTLLPYMHETIRRVTCIAIIMAVMTTGLCACTGKAEAPAYMDGNGAAGSGSSMIRMTRPVPDRYFSEAAEFLRVATFFDDGTHAVRPILAFRYSVG